MHTILVCFLYFGLTLDLHNKLENQIKININFNEDSDTLSLLLDSIFKVEYVKVNNQNAQYTFKDNLLVIQDQFRMNTPVLVEMGYEGKVDIKKDIGANLFYVTPYAVNLIGGDIFWYPSPLMKKMAYFNLDVNSNAKLYSNLPIGNGKMEGYAHYVSIFAGIYTEQTDEGIRYVYPPSMTVQSIKRTISESIENKTVSSEVLTDLKNRNYKQVIIGTWPIDGDLLKVESSTLYIRLD